MSAQTLTAISGVVLLFVFLLVRWNIRRRRGSPDPGDHQTSGPPK